MSQVNFKDDEFYGLLHFNVIAMEYENMQEIEVTINDFDDFIFYMSSFYKEDYDSLFKESLTVESIEFEGFSFKGRQDSESFSIDMTDGWKRATIIFDEKKFGDVNIDKLRRMKKIIEE